MAYIANGLIMERQIFKFSELNPKDRLTVEHYISTDLKLMQEIEEVKYPLKALGSFADVKGGKRLPPQAAYSSSGIPYVRVVDVGSYTIDLDNVVSISDDLHKGIARYQLRYNDIAIVIVGATIGKVAIFKSQVSPCNFNENMARITIKKNDVNPDYLLAYLQSRFGQGYINWLTGGAAQAKLSLERIQRIKVPIPPRPIQDRIAQIMQDAYAERRAKLVEAQALLDGIDRFVLGELGIDLESLLSNRFTTVNISEMQRQRFDIGPYMNQFDADNVLGSNKVSLSDIALLPRQSKTASKTPDAEILYIGMPDVDDITGEVNIQRLQGKEIKANKTVFKGGDVVFARIEPCIYNRKIALIPNDVKQALGSTELLVARAKTDCAIPEFLLWMLRSELAQRQIMGYMTGTTGRRRLPNESFASLQFPLVSLDKQQQIAEEATQRRNRVKKLKSEAEIVVSEAKSQVERMILGKDASA